MVRGEGAVLCYCTVDDVQLETRGELCRCGKDYLSSYADNVLPFEVWLKGAESRVKEMVSLSRSRDILLLERDEMKVGDQSSGNDRNRCTLSCGLGCCFFCFVFVCLFVFGM